MLGLSLGMIVEGSVAVLLAVTIGYCVILNSRLKRLHGDREQLQKMVGDLVQATALANHAVMELKTAALEADTKLSERLEEATTLQQSLVENVSVGSQLIEKIARITAAAKTQPLPEAKAAEAKPVPQPPQQMVEPQGRLASALQQLAMRPGIGGKAA
ncbi:MAG: chemotaxis protein [Hyphomicrobiales bacterium]|nr:MAG: chemotaxis protein [Hyphomicrobiales bacterium]